jgi:transposase
MKFIKPLSEIEQMQLHAAYKESHQHRVRQRAHAVLLSAKGYSIPELVDVFGCSRNAINAWLNAWNEFGIDGLQDEVRSGRPRILTPEDSNRLQALLDQNPHQLKTAVAQFEEEAGKTASLDTYRRTVKKI